MARVAPQEAGVASGLVNVTQQVGGAVGLAILVTVFATAGPGAASSPTASAHAKDVFVLGADRGFGVAAALIAVAVVLVLGFARPKRTPAPVPASMPALEPAA
jgi:ABC-type sugar transport system permease subunit